MEVKSSCEFFHVKLQLAESCSISSNSTNKFSIFPTEKWEKKLGISRLLGLTDRINRQSVLLPEYQKQFWIGALKIEVSVLLLITFLQR